MSNVLIGIQNLFYVTCFSYPFFFVWQQAGRQVASIALIQHAEYYVIKFCEGASKQAASGLLLVGLLS